MSEEESDTFALFEIENVLETVYGFRIGDLKVVAHFLNLRKSLPEEALILSSRSVMYSDVVSRNVSIFWVPVSGPKYKARGIVTDFVNLDKRQRALVIDGRIHSLLDQDYVIIHESKED